MVNSFINKKSSINAEKWLLKSCIFAVLLLIFTPTSAQNAVLKRADRAYQDLAFPDAIRLYQKVLKKKFNKTAMIRLANCYRLTHNYKAAAAQYAKVVALNQIPPINYFNYAQALMNNGAYQEAEQWYQRYAKEKPGDPRGAKFAESCRNIEAFYQDSAWFQLQNYPYNSSEDDFGPAWFKNGIIFGSARGEGDIIGSRYQWNDQPFLDLYFAPVEPSGQPLGRPRLLNGKLNSRFHEAGCTVDEKNRLIYFTRNNYFHGKKGVDASGMINLKLFYAEVSVGGWKNLRGLPFNSDAYSVGHPAIDPAGEFLYFISDMPGGFGGTDIYRARRSGNSWSQPENLGPVINTPGNEMFPFIHRNGRLFFASDGLGGLGGLDIFQVSLPAKAITPPINLGSPINSAFDDFGLIKSSDQLYGFFSSNRPGGKGGDDLYHFSILQPGLKAVVIDQETQQAIAGAKVIAQISGTTQQQQLMTADSGDFALLMLPETSYRLQISAAGYQPEEDVFYTFGMKPGEMFRDTFYLSLPPVKVVAQVLDGVTSDPVINAKVRVLGKDLNYSTDSAGQFSFLASPYPEYQSRKMDCPVQEAPSYCFRFSDTGGMDSDSASFVYEWDFGDGTQLRGAEVEHCYTNPGIYWVELNLIDTISGYHFLTESSYELEVRAPRQVFILGPDSLSRGQRIVFDGSGSYLPNCEVDRYRWEVDGSGVGFGPKLEYAFREVGLHKIRLQVNGEGRESPRTCGACVTKLVWVLEPGWPVQREDSLREAWSELPPATVGTDIECTPQLSESHCFRFEDIGGAEGDTIPFVYEWDLGDGTRRRGKVVEHCYAHAGNYRVRLHIIDPYLRKSTVLQTDYMLEVKDLNQVFVESWDTIRTGQPFLFDAYQSEVPGCKINSVFWDYGDGESGSGPETKHIYTRAGTYRVRLVLAGRSESGQQCEVCSYKEVVVQDDFRGKGNSKLVSDDNIIENSILDPEKVYFLELSKPGYKTKVVPYLVVDSVGVLLDSILMEPELDEVVVEGMVKSENGELLEGVTLRLLNLAGEELQKVTAKGGAFTLGLEAEKSYFLMAGKEGYLSRRKEIGPFGKLAGALSPISFDLEPVIIGKSMVLKHIYYDFDKYNLREKSEKALEKVLRFLQENPGIRVELGSHTDARGGDDYNLWLSQKRAEAATQFLIARGLDKTRILARGFGEQRLVNQCSNGVTCSEAAHQENRRTEITILGYSDAAYTEALLVLGENAPNAGSLLADSSKFSIELGIFSTPLPANPLLSAFSIELIQQGNLYIYRSGVKGDYAVAKAQLKQIQALGFPDAYIISLDESNAKNPVTASPELPALSGTDFYYTIQIAVLGRTTPVSYFSPLGEYQEMLQVIRVNGLKKYSVFRLPSYKFARKYLGRVRARGYHDAFITAYENGKRVSIETAIDRERKRK